MTLEEMSAEATATLSDLVDEAGGPLAAAQAMAILGAIEKTLWERVVQSRPHGAVTPDNVLIGPDGSVTLGPEADGGTAADDAFGFGLLTYLALTGQAPFRRSAPGVVVPVTDVMPGFPAFAAEVVMRALGDDDERRPSPRTVMTVLDLQPLDAWPSAKEAPVVISEATTAEPAEPEPTIDEDAAEHPRVLHGRPMEHHDEDDTGHRALGSVSEQRAFHQAIREVINPGHAIPEIAESTVDPDELPRPVHDPDAPNRPVVPNYRRKMKTVYTQATDENRRSTMLLVGAILLAILLGTAYALTRDDADSGADARQAPSSGAIAAPSPAGVPAAG